MPRRPSVTRRWLTAATWPIGIALTSWDYLWRTTPMHRAEVERPFPQSPRPAMLSLPTDVSAHEVQSAQDGSGPLFHRRYRVEIRDTDATPESLLDALCSDVNAAAPTRFARFQKVLGEPGAMALGDEYVVRMPGPWDGPVRVIALGPCGFRLATLNGHLEAGQIEFRSSRSLADAGRIVFEIESWARNSGWFSNLLYHRLHMSKEVQAHMWISFLEGVVGLAGGRLTGGVQIVTERIEEDAHAA